MCVQNTLGSTGPIKELTGEMMYKHLNLIQVVL